MKITNLTGLPEPIYKALLSDDYTKGHSNRSVTTLIDSPRVRILRKEHDDDITEDASDMVWSVLGRAVHKIFEDQSADGHVSEERLYAEVDNWVISGAIDLQRSSDGGVTLLDYKCTSAWSVIYGKKEWDFQLNFYAWLVEQCKDVSVTDLKIVVICRDWQRKKAELEKSYPQAGIVVVDIPLWSPEERDRYVRERVKAHSDAEFERLTGGELPLCTNEERWAKATKYAVKKSGNKRALRVYDSEQDALDALKDGQEVEERPGEFTRCEGNWCRVADFCDQWRSSQ